MSADNEKIIDIQFDNAPKTIDIDFDNNAQVMEADFGNAPQTIDIDFDNNAKVLEADFGNVQQITVGNVSVSLEEKDEGVVITAWDAEGEETALVRNGKDGYTPVKGKDYQDGKDGVSPVVELTETGDGVEIAITDADGTETALVRHGKDGYTPVKGVDYFDGAKGDPGYTPVKGVDYFDGAPGQPGKNGYTPIKGVDYFDGEKGDPGYTPIKGVDYFDGQPGQPGAPGDPGQPGADGISPVVTVQDITGGHRVTITDKDGEKTFDVMDGKDGTGGGGGGPAIIDVVALPETDIQEDVFYRLLSGKFYFRSTPQGDWTCYFVGTLPQEGVPVTTDMVHVSLYYAVDTGSVSGYIPPALAGAVGVPAGWYPVEVLGQAFGLQWGGIIWDESEAPEDDANRLVLGYDVYYYKQEWVNLSDKVGWQSPEGAGAEIFNSLRNTASGHNSHAEGYSTTASGNYSHAEGSNTTASGETSHTEGYSTTASGNSSHAEGYSTTASGNSSHAEGYSTEANGNYSHAEGRDTIASGNSSHAEGNNTTASGRYSHAEGNSTEANGNYSHAEGNNTTARGRYSHAEGKSTEARGEAQHVQGRYNVVDETSQDAEKYSKYAHIVGNGVVDETGNITYSNAHTLDWNGVAWYQGRPQFGGKAQDDGAQTVMGNGDEEIVLASPNGKLWGITVTDDGVLTVTAK